MKHINRFEHTDHQLIKLYLEGNEQAFAELVNRHKDHLFSFILTKVKDRSTADDLFQELWIRVVNAIRRNKYEENGKIFAWLIRIATNICFDHFRAVKRKANHFGTDSEQVFEFVAEYYKPPEEKSLKGGSAEALWQLIDEMRPEQREIVVLRHYADLDFNTIAEITGVNVNTALGRMRYALMNMRKMISKKDLTFGYE